MRSLKALLLKQITGLQNNVAFRLGNRWLMRLGYDGKQCCTHGNMFIH